MICVDKQTWVAVTEIESITLSMSGVAAKMRMISGVEFTILRETHYSITETVLRLVEKINHGKETMHGHVQD